MRQHGNDYISRGYRADGKKWREKASHSYVERDRLGSVHAIVAEDGTLEQHTDYHSGGLPSSRRPLAAVDNRLHTAKEFQNFRGIALYDNLARLYDPLTTRFTTVDPLAERTPWLSPYAHCANTPLRYIDPTGNDVWVLDNKAYILHYYKTSNSDIITFKNETDIYEMPYGTISILSSGETDSTFDGVMISDANHAIGAFEYISKHSEVEIGYISMINNFLESYLIMTNHEKRKTNLIFPSIKYSKDGFRILEVNHSHATQTLNPSGLYGQKGDIQAAASLSAQLGYEPIFKIYVPIENLYINYNSQSSEIDFPIMETSLERLNIEVIGKRR